MFPYLSGRSHQHGGALFRRVVFINHQVWSDVSCPVRYWGTELGKLVALLRQQAREAAQANGRNWLLLTVPGTGCPTIAAISGCQLAAIVTEPTLSAIHDLKRVIELCRHFKVKCGVIINKADLNPVKARDIKEYCAEEEVPVWGEVPFREDLVEAVNNCQLPVQYSAALATLMQGIWKEVEVSLDD